MALNLSSHVIQKGEAGSSLSPVVTPFVRLSNGSLALFVQDGAVYSEDGKRVKEANLPEWLNEELDKLSTATRTAVGLDRKPPPDEPNEEGVKLTPTVPPRKQVTTRKK